MDVEFDLVAMINGGDSIFVPARGYGVGALVVHPTYLSPYQVKKWATLDSDPNAWTVSHRETGMQIRHLTLPKEKALEFAKALDEQVDWSKVQRDVFGEAGGIHWLMNEAEKDALRELVAFLEDLYAVPEEQSHE